MTRDEIDDLMRDNGIMVIGEGVYPLVQLVIAAEREACAKVAKEWVLGGDDPRYQCEIDAAIRARGQV